PDWLSHHILRDRLRITQYSVSAISQLEVLGYHKLTPKDKIYFKTFFARAEIIPVRSSIIRKAIDLRQEKRMSLGDAIVAATAIVEDISLLTANAKDFKHLKDLDLIDLNEI